MVFLKWLVLNDFVCPKKQTSDLLQRKETVHKCQEGGVIFLKVLIKKKPKSKLRLSF